ncbi:MAG: hypothetical protein AB7O62_06570 [Pirellulales bacterium]
MPIAVEKSSKPASPNVRRRWLKRLAFVAYLLVLCEVAVRGYWTIRHGVPFFDMRQIFVGRFYPELRESGVLTANVSREDETLDVLILGGSVVTPAFGNIGDLLQQQLPAAAGRPVRVYKCANLALNSLDSVWKYERLRDQRFDLVLVYESINEARLNNCPPEFFRDDYEHMSWYRRVAALDRHPELPYFVLPYSLEYLAVGLFDHPAIGWYLPRHFPAHSEWPRQHGAEVKTAGSYQRNLERIIALACQRGATVCLPQYAYHIPDDATLERYQREQLGHWANGRMIEGWGTAEGVTASIDAHNAIIRELVAAHPHVVSVDMNGLLPHDGTVFNDPCHLSARGCELFVEHLIAPLAEWSAGPEVAKLPRTNDSPIRRQ